jgi:phage shock protein A
MAGINFFGRMGNLWRGFVSLWISDVEKKHPEIAYENAINDMTGKYQRLKTATAAIIRRREELTSRLKREQQELAQVEADLNAALDTDQEELAIVLIEKQNALEAEIAQLTEALEQSQGDADDAKSSLVAVKAEINKLKAEKDRMLAQMKSAQARIQIQDQLEGLSVDAEMKALDNVREHIKTTVAEAKLGKELADTDVDNRLAKLRQQSGSVNARRQLEQMKAARAQSAAAAKKSM